MFEQFDDEFDPSVVIPVNETEHRLIAARLLFDVASGIRARALFDDLAASPDRYLGANATVGPNGEDWRHNREAIEPQRPPLEHVYAVNPDGVCFDLLTQDLKRPETIRIFRQNALAGRRRPALTHANLLVGCYGLDAYQSDCEQILSTGDLLVVYRQLQTAAIVSEADYEDMGKLVVDPGQYTQTQQQAIWRRIRARADEQGLLAMKEWKRSAHDYSPQKLRRVGRATVKLAICGGAILGALYGAGTACSALTSANPEISPNYPLDAGEAKADIMPLAGLAMDTVTTSSDKQANYESYDVDHNQLYLHLSGADGEVDVTIGLPQNSQIGRTSQRRDLNAADLRSALVEAQATPQAEPMTITGTRTSRGPDGYAEIAVGQDGKGYFTSDKSRTFVSGSQAMAWLQKLITDIRGSR
jgi:hypothetical protein